MTAPVRRVSTEDEPALSALLGQAPVVNLFLRGFLAAHPVDRSWWYAVPEVRGAVLVMPQRVAVPFAPDPRDAARLGRHLRDQHAPTLVVGPRDTVDAMWREWAPTHEVRRRHDQRLYVLDRDDWRKDDPGDPDPPGFRSARVADAPEVALGAALMELEDLGTDPRREGGNHLATVRDRLAEGRTFVIERDHRIVFQLNVGTLQPDGAQLGGTWVPPEHRGQGLAIAGVRSVARRLLGPATGGGLPRVTLHVNEANAPAVAVYERVGFRREEPMRLIVP